MSQSVCAADMSVEQKLPDIDRGRQRFPFCVVWTPLPLITWLFPFIGHMGICTSAGVIRDFAGPFYVSEDEMAFGNPTKYWLLTPYRTQKTEWDDAVRLASEEYSHRMHNLCCNNCHSHVAMALNLMQYDGSTSWNMFKLTFFMLVYSHYVSFWAFLKTWLPFLLVVTLIVLLVVFIP